MDYHHHHHQLQVHIPQFVYNTVTLADGGGAEVLSFPPQHVFPAEHHNPSSVPFDFGQPPPPQQRPDHPALPPPPDLSALFAPPLGLPIYSASGFDLLSILARVATRPFPHIDLGPVDLTCAFVVVDVRRFDHPIVYCSPSFCTLTGYSEHEVIGRNCRFLQAPGGNVAKGDPRTYTSQDAVNLLRKSLAADKECQTSIVNYKKDGAAFINFVSVIPVPGGLTGAPDEHDIVYQVGFQVDLTEQPHAIIDRLRDGSYLVNYASHSHIIPRFLQPPNNAPRDRKTSAVPPIVLSKELRLLLADPLFQRSLPITNAVPTSLDDTATVNHPLSLVLLEALPDFVHVVSLKGTFLYVAPSVRRVLGYEADDMVGTSIADYAHPEDVIPLMRELKESSATGPAATAAFADPALAMPRSVDLLFRARTKSGRYVWVECRGRLHLEPGKGRKAIILSGRAREMMNLKWQDVRRAGGLARGLRVPGPGTTTTHQSVFKDVEQEAWGMLGGVCRDTATFMFVGKGMNDVLGWSPDDLLGRGVMGVVPDPGAQTAIGAFIATMRAYQRRQRRPPAHRGLPLDAARVRKVRCDLRHKDGGTANVWFVLYRADADGEEGGAGISITPAPLVYQIRLVDAETIVPGPEAAAPPFASSLAGAMSPPAATPSLDMFDELSTLRASSWQYELQQLRITNLKLRDELAALEESESASAGPLQHRQDQDQQAYGVRNTSSYDLPPPPPSPHQTRPTPPQQPLFTAQPHPQPQQGYVSYGYETPAPYLHQPTPVAQYHQLPGIFPRPERRGTPYDWNTVPSGPPHPPPTPTAAPVPGYPAASLKRSWSAVDPAG